jgi:hypothetical protein
MSLSQLGSLGEFLSFFAVLATLIYLALQTKLSREVATSQAARNVVVDFQTIWSTLGESVEKTEIIRFAVNDWDSISKNEQMIAHSFFVNLLAHFTSALEQEGKLPELKAFILGWEDNIMGLLQSEGGSKWYSTCNYLFLPIFRDRVKARLSKPNDLPPAWTDSMSWWEVGESERNAKSS